MEAKEALLERIYVLDEVIPIIREEKEKIEKAAKVEETRLDTEPHNGWKDFWTSSMKNLEAAIAPQDASYMEVVPLMPFKNGVNVMQSFCLQEGQRFEFFLNLQTTSTNGLDVLAIGLSTGDTFDDALVMDKAKPNYR